MLAEARSHSSAGRLASRSPLRGGVGMLGLSACGSSWAMPAASVGGTTTRQPKASQHPPVSQPSRQPGVQPEASSAKAAIESPTPFTPKALIKRPPEAPGSSPSLDTFLPPATDMPAPASAQGSLPLTGTVTAPQVNASRSSSPASHGNNTTASPPDDVSRGMQSPAQLTTAADAQLMMPAESGASNMPRNNSADVQLPGLTNSNGMSSIIPGTQAASPISLTVTSATPAADALGSTTMHSRTNMPAAKLASPDPLPEACAGGMDDAMLMHLLGISTMSSSQPALTAAMSPAPQHVPLHMEGPPGLVMLSRSAPSLATNGPLSATTMAALLALQQEQQGGQHSMGMNGMQTPDAADFMQHMPDAAELLYGGRSLSNSPINPQPQLMYDPGTGRLVGGEALVARALLSSPAGSMGSLSSGMYGSLPGSMEALCGGMAFGGMGMASACSSPAPGNIRQNSLYKTELCRSWNETSACRYGNKCQFAHGREELRPVIRHPKYKTEVCRTFAQTGTCPYGARCRFIHAARSASAAASPAGAMVPIGSPALTADVQLAYAAGMVKSMSHDGFMLPHDCMTPERKVGTPFMHTPSPMRYGTPLMDAAAMRAGITSRSIPGTPNAHMNLFGRPATAGLPPMGSTTPQQQAAFRRSPVFAQLTDESKSIAGSSDSSRQPASTGSHADDACWAAVWQGADLASNAGGNGTPPPVCNLSMAASAAALAASPGPGQLNGWLASPQQHMGLGAAQPDAAAASLQAANDAVNAILSVLNI